MNNISTWHKSVARDKHSLILSIIQYLKHKPGLLVAITTIVFYLLLFAIGENFKLAVVAALLIVALYYLITKNLFFSLFSAFLASMPFLLPAKQYQFEYASASEYVFNQWPYGWPDVMIKSISLTTSNLLGILIVLFFLLEMVKCTVHTKRRAPHPFVIMFNLPLFKFISFCWLGYFSVSLYSSLYYSFFPAYSLYMLFENSKLFIGFIGIIYLFVTKTRFSKYIYIVLLTALLFQNTVGISQFVTSLSPLGYISQPYSQDIEENIPFARIDGVSFHANIHAFIILILSVLVLPYVARRSGWLFNITIFLSLANVILSQSRTAWLSIIVVVLYVFIVLRNETVKFVFALLKGKSWYRVIFISLLALIIMLPRLQASSLFFSEDGGGRLRVRMILEGWQLLQESPFAGFGLGNDVKVFLNNYSESYATTFPLYVHFAFLQLALESGILGVIFFFLPFLVFLIKYAHLPKNPNGRSQCVLLGALCCIIILFVNFSLQPALGMLEFYLIGIALGSGVLSLSKLNPEIYL